jgi:hypothetical protein
MSTRSDGPLRCAQLNAEGRKSRILRLIEVVGVCAHPCSIDWRNLRDSSVSSPPGAERAEAR